MHGYRIDGELRRELHSIDVIKCSAKHTHAVVCDNKNYLLVTWDTIQLAKN